MADESGNWDQYSKLVLAELTRLHESVEDLKKELSKREKEWTEDLSKSKNDNANEIKDVRSQMENIHRTLSIEINSIKIKSGLLGLLAGSIPSVVFILIKVFG